MYKTFKRVKKTLLNTNDILNQLRNSQLEQRQLFCQLLQLKDAKNLPHFSDVSFRECSQFDEDGIILYIFSIIGFTNKYCIELACPSPEGANTTNLLLNWNFSGLLISGTEEEKENTKQYYEQHYDTWLVPPKVVAKWITRENINELLNIENVPKTFDFFSLDIDGVDYWVLKSLLSEYSPRVIVVESQRIWQDKKSVTIEYRPDFDRFQMHKHYYGASALAFVKLMKENGYRLVANSKYGLNLFFVKEDLCNEFLKEITVADTIKNLPSYYLEELNDKLNGVKNYNWIEV